MRRVTTPVLAAFILIVGSAIAFASSSNPPASRTGAPSESTCLSCHSGHTQNSGGSIQVLDAPMLYRAGSTYRIRVRIASTNTSGDVNRRWGFEITAINSNDGTGTGTFANVAGQGTSTTTGSGGLASRTYVRHTDARQGQASPAEWAFDWTAPPAGNIPVMFYVAGVAGNGSGSSGDWVYTNTWAAADTTTPVAATTWGQVKARYRK